VKAELVRKAESQSSRALWGGMALLSVQGGALAWLTWWVYSWDVMEPVTYFITYGTSLGIFAYCVLTNQVSLFITRRGTPPPRLCPDNRHVMLLNF